MRTLMTLIVLGTLATFTLTGCHASGGIDANSSITAAR